MRDPPPTQPRWNVRTDFHMHAVIVSAFRHEHTHANTYTTPHTHTQREREEDERERTFPSKEADTPKSLNTSNKAPSNKDREINVQL